MVLMLLLPTHVFGIVVVDIVIEALLGVPPVSRLRNRVACELAAASWYERLLVVPVGLLAGCKNFTT